MKPYEFARTVLNIAGFSEESDRFDHDLQGFCRYIENSVEVVRDTGRYHVSCQALISKTHRLATMETSVIALTADAAQKIGEALKSIASL